MLVGDGYAVLVVGGGPAGMAAAMATASAGLRTLVVDERPTLGGQVFKQPGPGFAVVDPARLGSQWRYGHAMVRRAERCGADFVLRTALVDLERGPAGWVAILADDSGTRSITVPMVIVTPGAYDRPVVFPGWTLPGVVTAGGLQTLAKTQRVLPGRRMVFAGSGPVALAFPAQLADFGADIAVALEAGPAPGPRDLMRLARALVGNQDLLRDAARYRATLLRRRVPLRYRRVVVRAEGDRRLDRVVHAAVDRDWRPIAGSEETVEADLLCLGYGFVPSVELLRLVGCEFDESEALGGPVVRRDAWCRTSVAGIFAAGDGAGVEGSYVAIDEGNVAGLAAASDLGVLSAADAVAAAGKSRRRLRRRRAFADAARPMYRVGPGLYELADEATVVCRCEEVTAGALLAAMADGPDVSVVKAATRAGMGPCQGRNCQRHIAAMISRAYGIPFSEVTPATQRMPVRPVAIAHMADHDVADPGLFLHGQT
jgi:thioredoxin reductase